MKRIILSLALVAVMVMALSGCCLKHDWQEATCEAPKTCAECGKTEGEALGHSWLEATCAAPTTCATCSLTQGEALEHIWEEATTEAPMTCTLCSDTAGERIITDERFTTAACKDLFGSWEMNMNLDAEMMGLAGYDIILPAHIVFTFENNGDYSMSITITDVEAFKVSFLAFSVELGYNQLADEYGLSREEADQIMLQETGMTFEESVIASVTDETMAESIETIERMANTQGVYYVADGGIFMLDSWDEDGSQYVPDSFVMENDTLYFDSLADIGVETPLTRIAE